VAAQRRIVHDASMSARRATPLRAARLLLLVMPVTVLSVAACSAGSFLSGCSSDSTSAPSAAVETGPDVPDFEEPVFDADDPAGRVLVLRLYDPAGRCFGLPTEIGRFFATEDGKIAPCKPGAVCYRRPDGVVAYHDQDCVDPTTYRANWTKLPYSDLGPCEPMKALADTTLVKECPAASCVFARDVVIDTAAGCASAITTKGCRDVLGKPTACFCDGVRVFVAADPKSSAAPPPGFSPCDATNAACKKALEIADAVGGCAASSGDAGPEAGDAG
jgi:hypothetical protein